MERKWWHSGTVYQIYPKSFLDTNGDGTGDIRGIIEKLDYIALLGVDIIWITPVFCSPMDDNGYDISNYTEIDPSFGTNEEMYELIEEAGKRGLKVILDLVVNHSSDEHAWFVESRASKDSPRRDYYVWRKGKDGNPPTDTMAVFGGSAWEYDEATGEYYLHMFSKKQPDLNWHNESLRREIYDMMNFWLDKGVMGFRMDVIDMIGKHIDEGNCGNTEDTHRFIHEMYENTMKDRDCFTVGETGGANVERAKLFSNPARGELTCVFQFEHISIDEQNGCKWDLAPFSMKRFKEIINRWETELGDEGCVGLFWNNHDQPRALSRWGTEGKYRNECAKMMGILLHYLRGVPFVYQGEEFGMTNAEINDPQKFDDIEMRNYWREQLEKGADMEKVMKGIKAKGRDNARAPMQWNSSRNCGFSEAEPWIAARCNNPEITAEAALEDKNSVFWSYKQAIEYRKTSDTVKYGDFTLLETADEVFAYERSHEGEKITVVCNFSEKENEFIRTFSDNAELIQQVYQNADITAEKITLRPYEALVVVEKI